MELREKIGWALVAALKVQTEGRWPHDGDDGLTVLVDDDIDFAKLADAILEMPDLKLISEEQFQGAMRAAYQSDRLGHGLEITLRQAFAGAGITVKQIA